jgi:hypothetical protein
MSYPTFVQLRESIGLNAEDLAMAMHLDPETFASCESDFHEAIETLELHQWATWAEQLQLPLLEMLAQAGIAQPGQVTPLTFRELRDALGDLIARLGSLALAEEQTGWELESFIRDPEEGWSRKLSFFQSLAQATGHDWRAIAAAYPAPL